MRPLKYKAYIKEYDRIVDVEILELLPNGEAQSIVVSDWELTDEVYRFTKGQFALMEFTGLLDTNKNDVYSGYIIECGTKHNAKAIHNFRAKVIWDKEYATYGIDTPTEGFLSLSDINEYTIIGNIYENKGLLNA